MKVKSLSAIVAFLLATAACAQDTGPIALDDHAFAVPGEPVAIPVTLNDRPPREKSLSISHAGDGAMGTVDVRGLELVYTAPVGFVGEDHFSYEITAGEESASATVFVTVGGAALSLTVTTEGEGTVRSQPAGIDCPDECSTSFDPGTTVELQAIPADGWEFLGWGGECSDETACVVVISDAHFVKAYFGPSDEVHRLAVEVDGQGRVSSTPPGIDCGTDCSHDFPEGARITLTAETEPGWAFTAWNGDECAGVGEPTCHFTATGDTEVVAILEEGQASLTVETTGSGSVTSRPAGINCGADCTATFPEGTEVLLTASPAGEATFNGWGGACVAYGTSLECRVKLTTGAATVTAAFEKQSPKGMVTVSTSGLGSGSVVSSPAGVACPADCSEPFDVGTKIVLTAQEDTDSTFEGWEGACGPHGLDRTCELTVTAAGSNVTAIFQPEPDKNHELPVQITGNGSGSVLMNPPGTSCTSSCAEFYGDGQVVTLTAQPGAASTFKGWGGSCFAFGTNEQCVLEMFSSEDPITATFDLNAPPIAFDDVVTGVGCTAMPVDLLGSDPDEDPLSFDIVSGPSFGTLSGLEKTSDTTAVVVYTPSPGEGIVDDAFTFLASDGEFTDTAVIELKGGCIE